jgi:hypothetical protein
LKEFYVRLQNVREVAAPTRPGVVLQQSVNPPLIGGRTGDSLLRSEVYTCGVCFLNLYRMPTPPVSEKSLAVTLYANLNHAHLGTELYNNINKSSLHPQSSK